MIDFSNYKAGDEVIVCRVYGWGGSEVEYTRDVIDRDTKTQLIVGSDRFRKTDGTLIGGSFCRLRPINSETLDLMQKSEEKKRHDNNVDTLLGLFRSRAACKHLSPDAVAKIVELCKGEVKP